MRNVYFWFSMIGWIAATAMLLWLLVLRLRKRHGVAAKGEGRGER